MITAAEHVIAGPGIEWARREIMIFVAGPIAERITCRRQTVEAVVAVHEAGHVVVQFLLGKPLAGASIMPWPGHSLGRATSRNPAPEDLKEPWPTDARMAEGLAFLGGLSGVGRGGHGGPSRGSLAPGAPPGRRAPAAQGNRRPPRAPPAIQSEEEGVAPRPHRSGEGPPQPADVGGGLTAINLSTCFSALALRAARHPSTGGWDRGKGPNAGGLWAGRNRHRRVGYGTTTPGVARYAAAARLARYSAARITHRPAARLPAPKARMFARGKVWAIVAARFEGYQK